MSAPAAPVTPTSQSASSMIAGIPSDIAAVIKSDSADWKKYVIASLISSLLALVPYLLVKHYKDGRWPRLADSGRAFAIAFGMALLAVLVQQVVFLAANPPAADAPSS